MNNIAELLGKIEVAQKAPERPDLPLSEWVNKLSEIITECVTPILKSPKNKGFKNIEFTAKTVNAADYAQLDSALRTQETVLKTDKKAVVAIMRSIKFSMECFPNSIASLIINLSSKDSMKVSLLFKRGKQFFQEENGPINLSDLLSVLGYSVQDPDGNVSFTEIQLIEMDLNEIYKS